MHVSFEQYILIMKSKDFRPLEYLSVISKVNVRCCLLWQHSERGRPAHPAAPQVEGRGYLRHAAEQPQGSNTLEY